MSSETDVVIVGAGPSGIFTALELLAEKPASRVVLVDAGLPVEQRSCPKERTGKCVGCDPCRITTGFSGAGAFSDGKLSLSAEVGGDLPDLIGFDTVQAAIHEVDCIYLAFGADDRVEGSDVDEEVKEIRRRAIQAGLKLVDCPIRHLGTECAQQIYGRIEQHLRDAGAVLRFRTVCRDIAVEGGRCTGVVLEGPGGQREQLAADRVVIATGRRGAGWLEELCGRHGIAHEPGVVDIGVRVELRNEVMERVNNVLYEGKLIGYPTPSAIRCARSARTPEAS